MLVVSNEEQMDVRLLRGSTVLVTAEQATLDVGSSSPAEFPGNMEDWVDFPASASAQIYTLQADLTVLGVDKRAYAGSFLLAEPIDG